MAKLVSKTYGDALFEVAMESENMDAFYEAAKGMAEVLRENEEFSILMSHPKIAKEEKIRVVEETFTDFMPKEMVGLMTLMVAKGRSEDMYEVLQYFISCVKEEKNIGIADITTAVELTEVQKEKVLKRLLETTKYETFEMHYRVDASLLGGMVVRIGDRVVDSSIQTKLYELSKSLRNIQV